MRIREILLSALIFLVSFGKINAQYFSSFDPDDVTFKYEVKLIDEFIERFNNNPSTKILKGAGNKGAVSRTQMLVSLFNLADSSFTDKNTVIPQFFHAILDPNKPVCLSFTDSDWYAQAIGVFSENGKIVEIPLVLDVQSRDDWSKWMIAGIGASQPGKEPAAEVSIKKGAGKRTYISTSAYATNFVELHYVFSDNLVADNFFEPALLATENGKQFIAKIRKGQLNFQYVKRITYCFYQVKGWIFTVDQFNRKTTNSGWLISSVQKVTPEDKKTSLKKLLDR